MPGKVVLSVFTRGASVLVAASALFGLAPCARAAPVHAAVPELKDLVELSFEQLSKITVSSVSRREQSLSEAPASVFVISADDIRRSGATSLPEALRLAPNLQIARADTNQYAISARGFNNVLANKMLVMIDGRTVYSPLFSGVFWEVQQVMLEDVERIEVISGPGATLWGANAVNGVINVITRRSADTQGGIVAATGGNREAGTSLRWGGALGDNGHYRVYGTFFDRDHSKLANGTPVLDGSTTGQAGFRADWGTPMHGFTLQGDAYRNDIEQAVGGSRDLAGANLLARWTRAASDGASLRIQAYYDRVERDQPGSIKEHLDTWDLDAQYGFSPGKTHRLLLGAGYRLMRDDLQNLGPALAFRPASQNLHRGHVFAQDEIALTSALDLTLGLKLEHNNYSGWESLPNVRLAWRPVPNRLLWTSIARAIRAPSRVDREFFAPAAPPFVIAGGPEFDSEVADVFEVGYRAQSASGLSYSMAMFHHDFDRLRTLEPAVGGATVQNRMEGRLNGINAWGSYPLSRNWRMTAGGVRLWQKLTLEPGSAAIGGVGAAGNDPKYWWQVGSSLNITPRHELELRVRHVASLPGGPVPRYTAVDARFGWRVTRAVELSLTVQNLFDPGHPEWGTPASRAEFERGAFLKVLWRI